MAKQDMLINFVPGEECRIAVVENGKLQELYTERADDDLHVGNIYRGRVTNVEPSIQAAFIDFGIGRNGFLHISDVHPRYFPGEDAETTEKVGKKTPRRDRPPIQKCLRRGDKVLVQVLKEGIGTKGPTLTSYLSLPGRFIVMLPNMERSGVSRKVEDDDARREMKKILNDLDTPEGFGFIVRTAGIGRTKTELKRDLAYLNRLWKSIDQRMKKGSGPAELYRESDLTIRTIRDVLSSDVKRIIVDDPDATVRAKDFMRIAMPRGGTKLHFYTGDVPLFDAFDIERQIAEINSREVPLPSGGSIVLEQTEALVAIDVNSGKSRDASDAETTAYNTNKEAVEEIARQLRLRDLGGVIVNDFIDMYMAKHRRDIEKRFRNAMKGDRAKTKLVRINELGLLSMTRQRMRPSLKKSLFNECRECHGTGHVKSRESVALDVVRRLAVVLSNDKIQKLKVTLHPRVITALVNRKRRALVELERRSGKTIEIVGDADRPTDQVDVEGFDSRGVDVDLERLPKPKTPGKNDMQTVTSKWTPPQDASARPAEAVELDETDEPDDQDEAEDDQKSDDGNGKSGGRKRRRRRGRRGRGRGKGSSDDQGQDSQEKKSDQSDKTSKGRGTGKQSSRRKSDKSGKSHSSDEKKSQDKSEQADDTDAAPSKKADVGVKTTRTVKRSVSGPRLDDAAKPSVRRRTRRQPGRRPSPRGDDVKSTDAAEGNADNSKKSEPKAASDDKKQAAETSKKSDDSDSKGSSQKSSGTKKKTRRKRSSKKSTTKSRSKSKAKSSGKSADDSGKKSDKKSSGKSDANKDDDVRQSGGYTNEIISK